MDVSRIGMGLAAGRLAIGAGMLAAPARIHGPWVGDIAERPGGQVLGRVVGSRDVVLAAGQLMSLRSGSGARAWFAAAAFCDVVDFAATAAGGDGIPSGGRYGVGAIAIGSAILSAWVASAAG